MQLTRHIRKTIVISAVLILLGAVLPTIAQYYDNFGLSMRQNDFDEIGNFLIYTPLSILIIGLVFFIFTRNYFENKFTAKKLTGVSILLFIIGVVVAYLSNIYNDFGFYYEIAEAIILPLLFFPLLLAFCSLICIFLREEVFRAWFKFARIYISLALIFIFFSALSPGGGSWGVSNNFDAEAATWFFSGLFLFISLILIARKSWKLKNKVS